MAAQIAGRAVRSTRAQIFNSRLDAGVTGFFALLVGGIFLISVREWILLLARRKLAVLCESPPTWLPDYALAEARPLHLTGLVALTFPLLREISGEAKISRLHEQCPCNTTVRLNVEEVSGTQCLTREQAYIRAAQERFENVNRCC